MKVKYYSQLEEHIARYTSLVGLKDLVDWDFRTIANSSLSPHVKKLNIIQQLISQTLRSDKLCHIIENIKLHEFEQLDSIQKRNLALLEKEREKALSIPDKLADHASIISTKCLADWEVARSQNNFQGVSASFKEMLSVTQELAHCKSEHLSLTPYESLMMDYDESFTEQTITSLFNAYLAAYPNLIPDSNQVDAHNKNSAKFIGHYPKPLQRTLYTSLMRKIGFDFKRGRLDESSHPFCTDTLDDIRITTRYNETDLTQSLTSILHETGHAMYRFNLPTNLREQLVGRVSGYAMDEAQAILFERMLGRDQSFLSYLCPKIINSFNVDKNTWTAGNLHKYFYHTKPSLIRVYADEMTYPLHIILRYRLEKSMLSGDLLPQDLPVAWHDEMKNILGIAPSNDLEGCLQDLHWYWGLWGYFPTYSTGAFIAAQLFDSLKTAVPDLDVALSQANFEPILNWLDNKVHSQACLYNSHELLQNITGETLQASYFINYIKERFNSLIPA